MKSNYQITRRNLLKSGGVAAIASLPGISFAASHSGFSHENPLAIPPLDRGEMSGGTRVFNLAMADGTTEFFPGYHTATKGINGSYLGPVLRMKQGENVRFNVTNNLDHKTTLHWHGFNLPATADGGPHQMISPGDTWSPEFKVREAATTMWYHSHAIHQTAEQVWAGLAGMVIIDDEASQTLELPSEYGVDDIPLVLQDRRFTYTGAMPYEARMHDRMVGMQGNYPVLNGTISPFLEVTRARIRIRLLNGSNASIYNLKFLDGRAFQVIGSDGGLLPAPVSQTRLRIAPGERVQIVVDMSDGTPAHLVSVGGGRGMAGNQNPAFNLLEMRPVGDLANAPAVPDILASLPAVNAADAVNTRRFVLEMPGMGGGMMMGRGGGFTINGKEMDMARVDHVIKRGEVEVWEIENAGPMAHPFHVHNTQFRVLDNAGRTPVGHEAGLKDTVLVDPGQIARIVIRFDHYSDPDLPYMFHCHILEHEDAGMMGQFTVV